MGTLGQHFFIRNSHADLACITKHDNHDKSSHSKKTWDQTSDKMLIWYLKKPCNYFLISARRVLYANFTSPASKPLTFDNFRKKISLESWKAACWGSRSRPSALVTPKTKRLEFWMIAKFNLVSVYAQDAGRTNCPSRNMTEKHDCAVSQISSNLAHSHEPASSIWISRVTKITTQLLQSQIIHSKNWTTLPRDHKEK